MLAIDSSHAWTLGTLRVVDRKHRAEMLVAFGVPGLGLLIYLVSLMVRWLRSAFP